MTSPTDPAGSAYCPPITMPTPTNPTTRPAHWRAPLRSLPSSAVIAAVMSGCNAATIAAMPGGRPCWIATYTQAR
ncbi:Uncharacterised protein [Burkholderia cepacia]|nr:hypothetical protein DM41_3762 [Burkholderia cepacia ATCC 25416]SPU75174.1 Uncharacterised protein [Burkholderia cepacia]